MEGDDLPRIGEQRHESLLSEEDVAILTGRKLKTQQRAALLAMASRSL